MAAGATARFGTSRILALMPGVSRSGSRSGPAASCASDRDAAARFGLPPADPIVFGAVVYKGLKNVVLKPLPVGSFVVGTLAAAAIGLIAIDLVLGYLRRHDYTVFVIYRRCSRPRSWS
jgi:undecaprenyl-diphosphatase